VPCVITSGGLTSRVRWPYSSARSEGARAGCFPPPYDLIHILLCYIWRSGWDLLVAVAARGTNRPSTLVVVVLVGLSWVRCHLRTLWSTVFLSPFRITALPQLPCRTMTTRGSRLVSGKGHRNVVGRRRRGVGRASSGPGVGLGWSAERWRQVGGRGERTHGP